MLAKKKQLVLQKLVSFITSKSQHQGSWVHPFLATSGLNKDSWCRQDCIPCTFVYSFVLYSSPQYSLCMYSGLKQFASGPVYLFIIVKYFSILNGNEHFTHWDICSLLQDRFPCFKEESFLKNFLEKFKLFLV